MSNTMNHIKKAFACFFLLILLTACKSNTPKEVISDNGSDGNEISRLTFLSMSPAFTIDGVPILSLEWFISEKDRNYSICLFDETKNNNCDLLTSVTNTLKTDVKINDILGAANKPVFILSSKRDGTDLINSNKLNINNALTKHLIKYIKANPSEENAFFGQSVALSADAKTLVIGADEESNGTHLYAGAVYIYKLGIDGWKQIEKLIPITVFDQYYFGYAVSLSDDGKTLAVSARGDGSSISAGINSPQDNNRPRSGAIYIYQYNNTWEQTAYLKQSTIKSQSDFGESVSLSGNAKLLVVGAPRYDEFNDDNIGAAYIFENESNVWTLKQALIPKTPQINQRFGINIMSLQFGTSVEFNKDGTTLAIGAPADSSILPGVSKPDEGTTPKITSSGAVYLFERNGVQWEETVHIKSSNLIDQARFGKKISLNSDGNLLAVSAPKDRSSPTSASEFGAVYVFNKVNNNWQQRDYIKITNSHNDASFGSSLSFNASGSMLAIGSEKESSASTGINGNQSDISSLRAGAVYLFEYSNKKWIQKYYIKAPTVSMKDYFGGALALSADGKSLAVGARYEDSEATDIQGDQANDLKTNSGAVFIY